MGNENGFGDARSGAETRDSGDARATDGGAAITRASAATAPGAPGSVSVEATGAAYASRGTAADQLCGATTCVFAGSHQRRPLTVRRRVLPELSAGRSAVGLLIEGGLFSVVVAGRAEGGAGALS